MFARGQMKARLRELQTSNKSEMMMDWLYVNIFAYLCSKSCYANTGRHTIVELKYTTAETPQPAEEASLLWAQIEEKTHVHVCT